MSTHEVCLPPGPCGESGTDAAPHKAKSGKLVLNIRQSLDFSLYFEGKKVKKSRQRPRLPDFASHSKIHRKSRPPRRTCIQGDFGCLSTSGILTVFQLSTISMKDRGKDPPHLDGLSTLYDIYERPGERPPPPHQSELNPWFDLTTQGQRRLRDSMSQSFDVNASALQPSHQTFQVVDVRVLVGHFCFSPFTAYGAVCFTDSSSITACLAERRPTLSKHIIHLAIMGESFTPSLHSREYKLCTHANMDK